MKITALAATTALALSGCYAEGYTAAVNTEGRTRYPSMRECVEEATSTVRPSRPKHEAYVCEKKVLGFTSEQQEFVRGAPIVDAEPSSDGA